MLIRALDNITRTRLCSAGQSFGTIMLDISVLDKSWHTCTYAHTTNPWQAQAPCTTLETRYVAHMSMTPRPVGRSNNSSKQIRVLSA